MKWKALATLVVAVITTFGVARYLPPDLPLWLTTGAAALDSVQQSHED